MHGSFVPIDKETLKRRYVDERLTASEIAHKVGCGVTTIFRRLERFGIAARVRGPRPGRERTPCPITWTPEWAYEVGLIATDGNLSPTTGRLSIMSNDVDLLESVRRSLDVVAPIRPHRGEYGHRCHRLAWNDRGVYDWLVGLGLTPAKSLTLGALAVPDEYFADFLRGCIDGDGSIVTYADRYNTFKNPAYVYTRLFVSIVSASPRFVDWLRVNILRLRGLSGSVTVKRRSGRRDIWCLRYAKRESLAVLRWMYYAPDVLCLARKRRIAADFLIARPSPHSRRPGRPVVV
jgi:hypothetical protein